MNMVICRRQLATRRLTPEQQLTEYGYKKVNPEFFPGTINNSSPPYETNFLQKPIHLPSHQNLSKLEVQRLTRSFAIKWRRNFLQSVFLILVSASGGVYIYFYLYGESVKQNVSKTASQIGMRALSDKELIDQANRITHTVIHGLLNDHQITDEVTRLLSNVVMSDQVRQSSTNLVINLLASESIQKSIGQLLYDQLLLAINHPTVQENLSILVMNVLSRSDVTEKVKELTSGVFTSNEITNVVKQVLGDAVVSDYVTQNALKLTQNATNSILNDPVVRQNMSDALYSTITPTFFTRRPKKYEKPTPPPPEVVKDNEKSFPIRNKESLESKKTSLDSAQLSIY